MACRLDTDAVCAGEVHLGFVLSYPAPGILEMVAEDWDWFFVDGQHGQLDYDMILQCVRTAELVQTPALVRVRDHSFGAIGPLLDTGCAGIIVPMVNTPEQARQVVDNAKFPPLGHRSYAGRRVIDMEGYDYWTSANENSQLIVQIETAQATDNIEAIVGTPGVDGILFGPADFRLSLGLTLDTPLTHPNVANRLARAAEVTRAAGKIAGISGSFTGESAKMLADMGYNLIACTADARLIGDSSPATAAAIREALPSGPRN